jgi:phosphate transport system permease protein
VAIGVALFLSEYAPTWSRRSLIAVVDLAAAIPSIIYGLWAVFELQDNVVGFSTWLSRHLSFIPFFKVNSPPLNASIFLAGLVVGLMIVPIVASISREVFSLAPAGEREAALALGASRWQMIRTVVLPFGRGGMIGALMLGLGRALEETIAVSIILGGTFTLSAHILQHGGSTISQLIAVNFGSGGKLGLHDLLLCGFVLFVLTLIINLAASAIVNRSRSGAGVDL